LRLARRWKGPKLALRARDHVCRAVTRAKAACGELVAASVTRMRSEGQIGPAVVQAIGGGHGRQIAHGRRHRHASLRARSLIEGSTGPALSHHFRHARQPDPQRPSNARRVPSRYRTNSKHIGPLAVRGRDRALCKASNAWVALMRITTKRRPWVLTARRSTAAVQATSHRRLPC